MTVDPVVIMNLTRFFFTFLSHKRKEKRKFFSSKARRQRGTKVSKDGRSAENCKQQEGKKRRKSASSSVFIQRKDELAEASRTRRAIAADRSASHCVAGEKRESHEHT